jgi:hypothetical protein
MKDGVNAVAVRSPAQCDSAPVPRRQSFSAMRTMTLALVAWLRADPDTNEVKAEADASASVIQQLCRLALDGRP